MIRAANNSHRSFPENPENPAGELNQGERRIIFFLLFVTLVMRLIYALHYTVDSDEPQHLHIVWGWVNGLLQYRDVFDNHTPLFHMLFAPVFAMVGERPEALFLMRLTMIPLYAAALWITYRMGRTLFSPRVGAWAAVFTALFPSFFLLSVEFRTDDLWTVFWLLALCLLVSRPTSLLRSLSAGVLLGAAMGVSLKTTLLLASLGLSSLATFVVAMKSPLNTAKVRHLSLCGLALMTGLGLIPTALSLFFYTQGALGPFLYGTVEHNVVPGLGRWGTDTLRMALFPLCCVALWWGARSIVRQSYTEGIGLRRVFIFFIAGTYIAALESFWPLVTVQNYLPVVPLIFLLLTPLLFRRSFPHPEDTAFSLGVSKGFSASAVATALAFFEIVLLLLVGTPWRDEARAQRQLLGDVLALTKGEDPVMDLKGEMVFRRRSYYYALETITGERIRKGLIADDIPERLVHTGTFVALADHEALPPRARSFLNANYLDVGSLRVAGQVLKAHAEGAQKIPFRVLLPTRYAIMAGAGPAQGLLDGVPYDGPRFLTAGHHEFTPYSGSTNLVLIWAQAVERGFSPFAEERSTP